MADDKRAKLARRLVKHEAAYEQVPEPELLLLLLRQHTIQYLLLRADLG